MKEKRKPQKNKTDASRKQHERLEKARERLKGKDGAIDEKEGNEQA